MTESENILLLHFSLGLNSERRPHNLSEILIFTKFYILQILEALNAPYIRKQVCITKRSCWKCISGPSIIESTAYIRSGSYRTGIGEQKI